MFCKCFISAYMCFRSGCKFIIGGYKCFISFFISVLSVFLW